MATATDSAIIHEELDKFYTLAKEYFDSISQKQSLQQQTKAASCLRQSQEKLFQLAERLDYRMELMRQVKQRHIQRKRDVDADRNILYQLRSMETALEEVIHLSRKKLHQIELAEKTRLIQQLRHDSGMQSSHPTTTSTDDPIRPYPRTLDMHTGILPFISNSTTEGQRNALPHPPKIGKELSPSMLDEQPGSQTNAGSVVPVKEEYETKNSEKHLPQVMSSVDNSLQNLTVNLNEELSSESLPKKTKTETLTEINTDKGSFYFDLAWKNKNTANQKLQNSNSHLSPKSVVIYSQTLAQALMAYNAVAVSVAVSGDVSGDVDNVQVCVRVRPMSTDEERNGCINVVSVDEQRGSVTVSHPNGGPSKTFTFDNSFPHDVKQVDVYNTAARPIVDAALEGYNGTIFAYGQTGTGKTYTMEGDRQIPEKQGIIPNSFAHIFGYISKAEGKTRFLVRCSYLEIYCEDVIDLLGDVSKKLDIKEHPESGVYVKGLTQKIVKSAQDMDTLMTQGNANRKVGSTNMNARSSRSHAVFSILIERSEVGEDNEEHVRMGKLNLVDLALRRKTNQFSRFIFGCLMYSKFPNDCNDIAVDGKSKHIPYRDSKLTRLLQDSLGGNAKTVMIANFGPANYNYDESINTLRYADRAKHIKNKPKINEDPKDALLREFLKQIEDLKKQLENEENEGSELEEGSGEEDENGTEDVIGWDGSVIKKKRKRQSTAQKSDRTDVSRPLSPGQVAQLQSEIDAERKTLQEQTTMATEEKQKAEAALRKREEELERQKVARETLQKRMEMVESKLIVGGVNLLDKAKEQEKLLESARAELEAKHAQQVTLHRALEDAEAVKIDLEQKYSSLEEELSDKKDKIKKLYDRYISLKADRDDTRRDYEQQLQGLEDNLHALRCEVQLQDLIINSWIPPEYTDAIERLAVWNEEIGDWQIPGLPHTGNNYAKTNQQHLEMQRALGVTVPDTPTGNKAPNTTTLYDNLYLEYAKKPSTSARPKSSRNKGPNSLAVSYRPATAQLY
eukprot:gene1040-4276_t